ncbi:winged helix-turn-helix domain-containing protein [Microbulbifer pacificus]|uniref:winged helix-turn-helix domain-containing protein n=1 Tax=Microbulbifer pacificus TaxID=407164 RepID=UPI001319D1E0|nr:winged helix-turn-helix domain-containing protein [Microbulbifer pacificus]
MFILKGLLRAETQEKALLYLLLRESGYSKEIADFYAIPTNPVQKQLARLEEDGVVISQLIGKVRSYQLNPRYPFLEPLKALLKAAVAAYPVQVRNQLLIQRTRPRQAGKSLEIVRTTKPGAED